MTNTFASPCLELLRRSVTRFLFLSRSSCTLRQYQPFHQNYTCVFQAAGRLLKLLDTKKQKKTFVSVCSGSNGRYFQAQGTLLKVTRREKKKTYLCIRCPSFAARGACNVLWKPGRFPWAALKACFRRPRFQSWAPHEWSYRRRESIHKETKARVSSQLKPVERVEARKNIQRVGRGLRENLLCRVVGSQSSLGRTWVFSWLPCVALFSWLFLCRLSRHSRAVRCY